METLKIYRISVRGLIVLGLLLGLFLPLGYADMTIEESGSDLTDIDDRFAEIHSNRFEVASLIEGSDTLTIGPLETDSSLTPVLFVLFILAIVGAGYGLVPLVTENDLPLSGKFSSFLAILGSSGLLGLVYGNINSLLTASTLQSDGRYLFDSATIGGSTFDVYVNAGYGFSYWLILLGVLGLLISPLVSRLLPQSEDEVTV